MIICGICQVEAAIEGRNICLSCKTGMGMIAELEQIGQGPLIHWGLPMYPDLWEGKGICGEPCEPEYTSAGLSITCPKCLELFREQNSHLRSLEEYRQFVKKLSSTELGALIEVASSVEHKRIIQKELKERA